MSDIISIFFAVSLVILFIFLMRTLYKSFFRKIDDDYAEYLSLEDEKNETHDIVLDRSHKYNKAAGKIRPKKSAVLSHTKYQTRKPKSKQSEYSSYEEFSKNNYISR